MREFLAAIQFLTILPLRVKGDIDAKTLGRSMLYFPLVGFIIGCILAVAAFGASQILPQPVVSAIVIIVLILLTGGLHLDGFADTCDAFYTGRDREKILEIMRDSHVGAMGAVGLISLLLLKFTLLSIIEYKFMLLTLIIMPTISRWTMVLAAYKSTYPRREGSGKPFVENVGSLEGISTTIFTFLLSIIFMQHIGGIVCFLAIPISFALIKYIKGKIGGMTGDTLGAINEVIEVAVAFSIAVLSSPTILELINTRGYPVLYSVL